MKILQIKTIILIVAMGMISYNTMAQKANHNVPQAVFTAFSAKYPQAQVKKWKTKDNTCTALFVMDNKKYQASFSNDGNWINTVRDIRHKSSLPAEVRLYLEKGSYASWHVDDMKRVRTPLQNMYQVEVDNNSGNKMIYEGGGSFEDKMLCFDDNGKLIKTVDN